MVQRRIPGKEDGRQDKEAGREEWRIDADVGECQRRDLRSDQPGESADRIVEPEILTLVVDVDVA